MSEFLSSVLDSIIAAVQIKFEGVIAWAPSVLMAVLIFFTGLILAELASRAIIRASEKLKLEFISDKIGLKHFLKRSGSKMTPSSLIAKGVKGYLVFLFFIESTKFAGLSEVAQFLTTMIGYVPDLIIALFIILVGIRIGGTIELIIKTSLGFAKASTGDVLGIAAKYTVIVFSALAALSQLQIAEILINTLFIGFVAMLTIAGGLAFGLGGKDVVKELLEAMKRIEIKQHKRRSAKK